MGEAKQRLDKWLWFARFAKTRTSAAGLVLDGHIRVNGVRITAPAKAVRSGDVLTIAAPHRTALVRILAEGTRRGPATEAAALYEALGGGDGPALVTDAPED